jgi:hypothetical protein
VSDSIQEVQPKSRNKSFGQLLAAALISGAVVSTITGIVFTRYVTRVTEEVRSQRTWKERCVEDLLGPLNIQFARTKAAFDRYRRKNTYLEAKVIKTGNETIRDLLLTRGHLIPPELRDDAVKLVEHYDVWLEVFERQRGAEAPALASEFVFAGPEGFHFPEEAEAHFRETFRQYWNDLYAGG